MRTQFTSPDEMVAYIMQEYERTGAFTLRELDGIRATYEEWAIASFEVLRNLSFKHLDKMIAHGIRVFRVARIMQAYVHNNEETEDERAV